MINELFTIDLALVLMIFWGTLFAIGSFIHEIGEVYILVAKLCYPLTRHKVKLRSILYLPLRLFTLVIIPWAIITVAQHIFG